MIVETATIAIMVTIMVGLLTFAAWVGALHQRSKSNTKSIEDIDKKYTRDIKDVCDRFALYQAENKQDHRDIILRLENMANGKRS